MALSAVMREYRAYPGHDFWIGCSWYVTNLAMKYAMKPAMQPNAEPYPTLVKPKQKSIFISTVLPKSSKCKAPVLPQST